MDASWFEPVRAYCERTDGTFWSEPLNAVSNGAFLVAAGAAAWPAAPRRDVPALALAGLVAVVGIGSFLFHTLANRWSLFADVIPIGAFIYAYFLLAMRRFLGLPAAVAVVVTALFAAFNIGFSPGLDALTGQSTAALTNGSIFYVPAILALLGVGAALRASAKTEAALTLLGVAGLFLLSLTFRTIDQAVCARLPTGTHMLWHLLNALVLYALIAVAVRFRDRAV